MKTHPSFHLFTAWLAISPSLVVFADADNAPESYLEESKERQEPQKDLLHSNTEAQKDTDRSYESFTGKISRNKVRMRLQPSLEAAILKELPRDTLISVVGESDEFYAVLPLKETKAYIFRTLVLENVVEGSRVNVRLEPAIEAPVIAQLNSGDKVDGVVSALNSKWLEITPPESTRFYICKEYVEKIGPSSMITDLEKRGEKVSQLLKTAYLQGRKELQKGYSEVDWDSIAAGYNDIIANYADFPSQVSKAKELLATMQENYLQKKVAYLEDKVKASPSSLKERAHSIASISSGAIEEPMALPSYETIQMISEQAPAQVKNEEDEWNALFDPSSMNSKMAFWIAAEKALFDAWSESQSDASAYNFYQQQALEQIPLHGIIEPYARAVRNKPGDYILVNQSNNLPIAYLYSTKVNLQEKIGQKVSLEAISRPNNNFAFPAYYIIAID